MKNLQNTFTTSKWLPISASFSFEGQVENSNPFYFILNTLPVCIDLKVLLGSLFRWSTISRDFTPRLIPMSDEYGGLIKKKRTVESKGSNILADAKCFEFISHRIHFAFDFHKFIIYPVIIADSHNHYYIKSIRIWSYPGQYFPAFGLNTERYSGKYKPV